jgi:hypothetical protein
MDKPQNIISAKEARHKSHILRDSIYVKFPEKFIEIEDQWSPGAGAGVEINCQRTQRNFWGQWNCLKLDHSDSHTTPYIC